MGVYNFNYLIETKIQYKKLNSDIYNYVPIYDDYLDFAYYISDDCPKITEIIVLSRYPLPHIYYLDGYHWEMLNLLFSCFFIFLYFYFINNNSFYLLNTNFISTQTIFSYGSLNFWNDFYAIIYNIFNLFLFCYFIYFNYKKIYYLYYILLLFFFFIYNLFSFT